MPPPTKPLYTQIGVPSGFAMTLSFPERVTAWNVEQLRTAVINGAHTWPGAVAVETADGKLIHLERLEKKVCWGCVGVLCHDGQCEVTRNDMC